MKRLKSFVLLMFCLLMLCSCGEKKSSVSITTEAYQSEVSITYTLDTTGTDLGFVEVKGHDLVYKYEGGVLVVDKVTGAEILLIHAVLDGDYYEEYKVDFFSYPDYYTLLIEDEKAGNLTFCGFTDKYGRYGFLALADGDMTVLATAIADPDSGNVEEQRREAYEAFKRLTFTVDK